MNWSPDNLWKLAQSASASGLAPDGLRGSPDACFYVMCAGVELGLPPVTSLRVLTLIKGRLTIGAEAMLALAIRAGARAEWVRADAEAATLRLTRDGHPPYSHTFTALEARMAGLGGDNWRKYPAAMLRARCISGAVRAYCPDAVTGLYTPEEVAAFADADDATDVASIPGPTGDVLALPDNGTPDVLDVEVREFVSLKGRKAAAKLSDEGILADVEEALDKPAHEWTDDDVATMGDVVRRVRAGLEDAPASSVPA